MCMRVCVWWWCHRRIFQNLISHFSVLLSDLFSLKKNSFFEFIITTLAVRALQYSDNLSNCLIVTVFHLQKKRAKSEEHTQKTFERQPNKKERKEICFFFFKMLLMFCSLFDAMHFVSVPIPLFLNKFFFSFFSVFFFSLNDSILSSLNMRIRLFSHLIHFDLVAPFYQTLKHRWWYYSDSGRGQNPFSSFYWI